jgi:hypothetical protein
MAGPCNGFCPDVYAGYDNVTHQYYFWGWLCGKPPVPNSFGHDTRMHQLGGDCTNCVDCIQALRQGNGNPIAARKALPRKVYRKGVPHPRNSFHHADEFCPGPHCAVLADHTVEYSFKRKRYHARLFTVACYTHPGRAIGLGWELDPKSPSSPFVVPHFSSAWVNAVKPEPGGHRIDLPGLGTFHVQTT